jgi:hypothetical protein
MPGMGTQENKAVVRRFMHELLAGGNLDVADAAELWRLRRTLATWRPNEARSRHGIAKSPRKRVVAAWERQRRGHASDQRPCPFVLSAIALMTVILARLVTACASPPNPDPGNRHLNALAADPIFATLPPGAAPTGPPVRTPARERKTFGGSVWDGPGVSVTFTSKQPQGAVFTYYVNLATSAGWVPNGNKNILGYPEVWNKTFPGGARASLALTDMDIRATTPGTISTYILNASA